MSEKKRAQLIGNRLGSLLDKARAATRTHGGHDVDRGDARQPGKPDHQSQRQVWIARLAQNNQRQLSPETMQSHDGDVSNEEYDECAKSQEMQTPCALPSVKYFYIPRKTRTAGDIATPVAMLNGASKNMTAA